MRPLRDPKLPVVVQPIALAGFKRPWISRSGYGRTYLARLAHLYRLSNSRRPPPWLCLYLPLRPSPRECHGI